MYLIRKKIIHISIDSPNKSDIYLFDKIHKKGLKKIKNFKKIEELGKFNSLYIFSDKIIIKKIDIDPIIENETEIDCVRV